MRGQHPKGYEREAYQQLRKRVAVAMGTGARLRIHWIASAAAALMLIVMTIVPARANAGAAGQVSVGISVSFGPPPLPYYQQPICPGPGYIWTPGYWAWDPGYGYFWVPGTWVMAPAPGLLWTPGYWGWSPDRAVFMWHAGYWGPHVGFYGGIDYGFGYPGRGYYGGYWRGDHFFYNRAVNRVDVYRIHYFYDRDEHHDFGDRRVSYNGGRGGINAWPTRDDLRAEHERRMWRDGAQDRHERMARRMPGMRWSENHGRPDIAATPRAERFDGRGIERASRAGGPYRGGEAPRNGRPDNGRWRTFGDRQDTGRGQDTQRSRSYQPRQNERGNPGRQDRGQNWQDRRGQPQERAPQQYRGGQPERRGGYQQRQNGNRQQEMRQGGQRRGAAAESPRNRQGRGDAKREKGNPGNPHGRRHF